MEYDVVSTRMTWRPSDSKQSGEQELAAKLNAAARKGWRLERLTFHNVPQGEGYVDQVTAYAVLVRDEEVE